MAGVVPNKSEEEICVALHDHDYDPERAITHLLDADANQVRALCGSFVLSFPLFKKKKREEGWGSWKYLPV